MQPKNTNKAEAGSTAPVGGASLSTMVLASGALAVALAAVSGVAWGVHTEAASRGRARLHEVRSAAGMVGRSAELLLAQDGVEELPRLFADATAAYDLTRCRLRVSGGETIAEAGMTPDKVVAVPENLPASVARSETVDEATAEFVVPVRSGQNGELMLEISASVASPWDMALAKLGVPMVAGVGLLGLFVTSRMVGGRVRALGTIGKALGASVGGGGVPREAEALMVSEGLGAEARAWNAIVADREALRRFAAFKEAGESGKGAGVSSDLAAACDAMSQGILILDDRLRVKYANGAAATLLAVKRDDLVDADIRKFVGDSTVIGALEGVANGRARQRVSVETSRVGPQGKAAETSGERPGSVLRFSARPVRREEQGVAMVVVEDVTQQKVADDARNSFVAQATHELRTPLTNIRLYTEAMIEDGENAEMRTKSLNVISSESRRLERIVADMLSVSEIEAGTLKVVKGDVRLDQLFDELKEDYRALAEDKEISLVFELPPKLPVISGDRDKLALAMHNLIANAIKYTPAGGKVTIRAEDSAGQFVVHVADNGIGIKPEEQDLIFERFYRAKDTRVANLTGTGLGLTLARDIARLHGGDIVLQSELNKGSTFTLELPTGGAAPVNKAA